MIRRLLRLILLPEDGFTLVELLVSMGLLTIGLVGVGAALLVQSGGVSAGSSYGLAAVTRANYISTATMLAQQRLEQVKNATYTTAVDGITTANFPPDAYNSMVNFPNFRRTVTIQDNTPGAAMKTITVNVFFQPPREVGFAPQEEVVQFVTIIARRP